MGRCGCLLERSSVWSLGKAGQEGRGTLSGGYNICFGADVGSRALGVGPGSAGMGRGVPGSLSFTCQAIVNLYICKGGLLRGSLLGPQQGRKSIVLNQLEPAHSRYSYNILDTSQPSPQPFPLPQTFTASCSCIGGPGAGCPWGGESDLGSHKGSQDTLC